MITNEKYHDLKLLYKILDKSPKGLESLRNKFISHISKLVDDVKLSHGAVLQRSNSVSNLVELANSSDHSPNAIKWVQAILLLQCKVDLILNCFNNDISFVKHHTSSFSAGLNDMSKFPEFLSVYIDSVLRRNDKNISDGEIESILDKVIVLFRFISEKDVFERYYKLHLSKRLLNGKSSEDFERSLISRLKV